MITITALTNGNEDDIISIMSTSFIDFLKRKHMFPDINTCSETNTFMYDKEKTEPMFLFSNDEVKDFLYENIENKEDVKFIKQAVISYEILDILKNLNPDKDYLIYIENVKNIILSYDNIKECLEKNRTGNNKVYLVYGEF